MQLYKIAFVVAMFAFSLFLTIGGYLLHRDRQWRRIWEKHGKPEVKGIKELRALIKKQDYSDPDCKSTRGGSSKRTKTNDLN